MILRMIMTRKKRKIEGAIPTAAAVNWVLKDGIGYLSKIMLSKYGRQFNVNPKGWRLFTDFLENAVVAGRSAAALIQKISQSSCFTIMATWTDAIGSVYDYIFMWDEDLGVKNFHPGRYLDIVKSEGLEISQPALDPNSTGIHHRITIRKSMSMFHR
ncbi:hypothetical protein ACS0TY_036315 [Phlomoides rotata]